MAVCNPSICNFTFPIYDTECIGDSINAINLNFGSLDSITCNTNNHIASAWNPVYSAFNAISSKLHQIINVVQTNSACWEETFTTVNTFSGFWLKPLTLIYPFPFTGDTNIATITDWVNVNFPPKRGNCFNYIVGQELYINSPEYTSLTKSKQEIVTLYGGMRLVPFDYCYQVISRQDCIPTQYKHVNCGVMSRAVTLTLQDQYIDAFQSIKYVLNSSFIWEYTGLIA